MFRQSMTTTQRIKEVSRTAYSDGLRSKVNCYGANDVREGVAIMWKEGVDVSITGNSTNPTRSSIQLQEHTKKNASKQERNTSQLLPVVVQDVHFTQTTWQQDRLLTV